MPSVESRQATKTANKHLIRLYKKRACKWGESYLIRHWWRIGAMYDIEDIRQDAFAVFLRVYRRHPKLPEPDLFRIYKRGIQGRLDNRSRQCFPNSYAYVAGQGRLVSNIDDDTRFLPTTAHEADTFLEYWSDVSVGLPRELAEVLKLLIRDFVGTSCIEQRRKRKLSGRPRIEPLSMALTRLVESEPSRDLLSELEAVLVAHNDETIKE